MSLNLEEKKEVVAEVSERLTKAQTVVLAEYRGLPVEHVTRPALASARFRRLPSRAEEHPRAPRGPGNAVREAGRPDGRPARLRHFRRPGGRREGAPRVREGERQARHQGRRDAQLRDDGQGGRQPCHHAQPRGAARQAAGHDAGADHQVRPDAERGADASSCGPSPPYATRRKRPRPDPSTTPFNDHRSRSHISWQSPSRKFSTRSGA